MSKIKLVELVDATQEKVKEKKEEIDRKAFVRRIKKSTTNETFVPISMIAPGADLSEATILYDADVYSILNPTLASILKDEALLTSVTNFLDLVDKSIDVVNNIKNIISLLKEHKFEDYKIAAITVAKAKMLDLSKLDFIKQYIIEPYLNNVEPIVDEEKSSVNTNTESDSIKKLESKKDKADKNKSKGSKDDKSKPEENEAPVEKAGAEKLSRSERKKLKKQKADNQKNNKHDDKTTASDISNKFTEEVDVNRSNGITPADLVKNINNKKNNSHKCNCGDKCTCGGNHDTLHHGKIPKAVIQPIHPELDINGKAELLKKHIEFNGKNKNLTLEQIDNLLRMLEGPYLKQKLTELKSVCNPAYPMLKQIDSDNPAYDFAFSTESQSGINIIVRMNSHTNEFNGIYISIGYEQKK